MQIEDLEKLVHLGHSQNIQKSAVERNITAGALSKTLKKVEDKLGTILFDRNGRNIQLNTDGKKFMQYAVKLTHEYRQMCSEFANNQIAHQLKLSGPSVLLNCALAKLTPKLAKGNIAMTVEPMYEGRALEQLINGQSHIAVVTHTALPQSSEQLTASGLSYLSLGTTTSQLVAAKQHAIFELFPHGEISAEQLKQFAFACPKTSPFCGVERGIGSDGWLDHQYPRHISIRTDDINSLLSVVNQGTALAYIADMVIDKDKHRIVNVMDITHQYQEHIVLVYRPSFADGWLNQLINSLA